MRKLITTKHSEFAQNGENMALVKTKMPGSKPIMISTSTFMEALKNSNEEVTEMLGLQADEYYIKPIVQSGDTINKAILKMPPITITNYDNLFSTLTDGAIESLITSVAEWADGPLTNLCYENNNVTTVKLDSERVSIDTTSLNSAFYYCRSIKHIDLSGVHNSGAFTILKAFTDCYELQFLDVRNLDWTLATAPNAFQNMSGAPFRNVPTTCKVIVGTDADKERLLNTATIGATKLNVMTVAEYEASLEV